MKYFSVLLKKTIKKIFDSNNIIKSKIFQNIFVKYFEIIHHNENSKTMINTVIILGIKIY
jgi:hypothetical protein